MLISLFERAYLVAYKEQMSPTEQRRWNSWDDYMREWCRREDFAAALDQLLRGEDPDFAAYIERVARQEREAMQREAATAADPARHPAPAAQHRASSPAP
jgi:hypothetical protein